MPNRLVTITATTVGGGINSVDIYHTSVSVANLITQSITPAQLLAGFEFSDDDSHTVYIVSSDSACNTTASITINAAPVAAPVASPSPSPAAPTPIPTAPSPSPVSSVAPTASPVPAPAAPSPVPAAAPTASPVAPVALSPSPVPAAAPTASPAPAGGGSSGGGCLVYGTPILLSDGNTKNVEDLVIGDQIISYNINGLGDSEEYADWSTTEFNGTAVTSSVTANVLNNYTSYYLFNNVLKATYEHPILIDRAGTKSFERAEDVVIGDSFFNSSGIWMEVTSKELITENIQVANPDMEPIDNYYANGYLVHNTQEEKQVME